MTTPTELLRQALEALERFNQCAVPIVNTVNPVEFTWSRARLDVANQRAEHVVAAITPNPPADAGKPITKDAL